jgi:pimeloyl-ACP methyl ester carboxylesterase
VAEAPFPWERVCKTIVCMNNRNTSATNDAWRSLYPSCERHMMVGRWRYHYLDNRGDAASDDSVATILCVHGNPTWSFYWRSIFDAFGDRFRVIAVDHLGCGLSDKPLRSEFRYSLAGHRDNLIRLIDHLELRNVILLAHDWGGAIGLAAAVARLESMSGLMLLNTAAFPPPYLPWRIAACRTPLLGTLALRGLNLFARAAVPMAMSKRRLDPAVAQGLLFPYGNWRDRVGIDSFVRDIPLTTWHRTDAVLRQLEQDLSKLADLPKLLVWGMRDWCFRHECLNRFLLHWPDATTVRLPDVGHYVIEDDPQGTHEAIGSFLGSLCGDNAPR